MNSPSLRRAAAYLAAAMLAALPALLAGCRPEGPNPSDAGGTDMFTPPGPQCSNGADDDGDGRVDFPLEPGCTDALDDDETDPVPAPACSNGLDDDGDGRTDYGFGGLGGDPGCTFAADDDEADVPECMDTVDNDGDMLIDFPDDPGCSDANDVTEFQVECKDGVDNDGDMLIDFPDDPDCDDPLDGDEQAPPVCNDGLDNDGDALTDFPMDPGCDDNFDADEFNPADCQGLTVEDATGGSASGDTTGLTGSIFASGCGGGMAPEGLAFVRVPSDLSHIELNTFGSDHDTVISLLPACDPAASEVACSSMPTNAFLEIDDLPAGDYWVVVDGGGASDIGFWRVGYFGIIAPGQGCVPGDTQFLCDLASGFMCMEVSPGAGAICTAGVCSDGLDNDMDGITDWPWDPGCLDPADGDEMDPMVAPACIDGMDNDGDLLIDYPADPGCSSTADTVEIDECIPGVNVNALGAGGVANGTLAGASNFDGSCTAAQFVMSPEQIYAFDVPAIANVRVSTANPGTVASTAIYVRSTCDDGSTELGCTANGAPGTTLALPATMPGTYFAFVDGNEGSAGAFELSVSGDLLQGQPCDPASMQWTCVLGTLCTDPGTGFECTPTECNDGSDNDGDMLADYPNDPGCTDIADNDETTPMVLPQCFDGIDNDMDGSTDYPMDNGCQSASDDDESCSVWGTDAFGYVGCEEPMVTNMPCEDISATGTPLSLSDDSSSSVPLPFSFDFYGTPQSSVSVISNGKLGFTGTTAYTNSCSATSSGDLEGNTIAPFWDDLNPSSGGTVRYEVFGTAPNRHMTILWNIPHYAGPATLYDIRAVLYEGTSNIDFCYVSMVVGNAGMDNGASATVGIRGASATDELQYPMCNAPVFVDDLLIRILHP